MKHSSIFFVVLSTLLFMGNISADTKTVKTHKIQIVLNIADPSMFSYVLNTGCLQDSGCTFVYNFFATRALGTYNLVTGQIYPGGTVSKKQNTYTVDKHGHQLTAKNSIGVWECAGDEVDNLNWFAFPPKPTRFEIANWDFYFKKNCYKKVNSLYSRGEVISGTFNPAKHKVAVNGSFVVTNGSGCNEGAHGNYTAKLYVAPLSIIDPTNASVLIKIKFDEPITIAVH